MVCIPLEIKLVVTAVKKSGQKKRHKERKTDRPDWNYYLHTINELSIPLLFFGTIFFANSKSNSTPCNANCKEWTQIGTPLLREFELLADYSFQVLQDLYVRHHVIEKTHHIVIWQRAVKCEKNWQKNMKQESPPAWAQEAYRPPRGHSNFLLFGGGGSLEKKIFFPVWTCIKPNLVSKNFPFTGGGGGTLTKKFFFPVWTCIKPNLVSKNFPFTRGGSLDEKFFFQSEHVSSQIWCQKIFPLLGGGGGGSLNKKFFFQSEHVSSQIWCQKIFPLLGGVPRQKKFFSSLNMYQAKSGVKKFSLY